MARTNNLPATLKTFYGALYEAFGPQGWWPGKTRFEVIVGAILTQNTAWTNVEKAIKNLKSERLLTPENLKAIEEKALAGLIRPAGYFNIKAKRIKSFLNHLYSNHDGSLNKLLKKNPSVLRAELLSINGIGPETADSIMLYAGEHPEFVVDAYTKRILSRHGIIEETLGYEEVKALFMEGLPRDVRLYNEYHALIVRTGKDFCRKVPKCSECPLGRYLR